jgi:hypothetical protein
MPSIKERPDISFEQLGNTELLFSERIHQAVSSFPTKHYLREIGGFIFGYFGELFFGTALCPV